MLTSRKFYSLPVLYSVIMLTVIIFFKINEQNQAAKTMTSSGYGCGAPFLYLYLHSHPHPYHRIGLNFDAQGRYADAVMMYENSTNLSCRSL